MELLSEMGAIQKLHSIFKLLFFFFFLRLFISFSSPVSFEEVTIAFEYSVKTPS